MTSEAARPAPEKTPAGARSEPEETSAGARPEPEKAPAAARSEVERISTAARPEPEQGSALARPEDGLPSVLRFATELVAWVATPWWLAHTSWVLSVLSLIVLVGLPTVFATPGDKAQVLVAVPGWATVLLVLTQLAAAVVSAWAVWPAWAAVCASVLAAVTLVTEGPRRRRLLGQR